MSVLDGQEAFWMVWESFEDFPGVREYLGAFGLVPERFVAFWTVWSALERS